MGGKSPQETAKARVRPQRGPTVKPRQTPFPTAGDGLPYGASSPDALGFKGNLLSSALKGRQWRTTKKSKKHQATSVTLTTHFNYLLLTVSPYPISSFRRPPSSDFHPQDVLGTVILNFLCGKNVACIDAGQVLQ